jgi:hypothetical protein
LDQLFSDGLSFLNQSYEKQWFESTRRLRRIEEQQLADSMAQATGTARYFDAVRAAHTAYADTMKITEADSDEEEASLAEGISRVRDAISRYVVQVIAWAQQDDSRYLEEGYLALRPIDAARDAAARAVASGTELGDKEETTQSETSTASSQPAADSEAPPTSAETPEGPDPEEAPAETALRVALARPRAMSGG